MIDRPIDDEDGFVTVPIDGREVPISTAAWDRLRGECPVPCTSEDQTDHAHGMVEALAREAAHLDADELVTRYGAANPESAEANVLSEEIDRRRLDT